MSLNGRRKQQLKGAAIRGGAPSGPRAHIFVATPTYTGDLHHRYVKAYADALYVSLVHGVRLNLRVVAGASLIQYARNQLLREFLADKEATHLLWIDADVGFDPNAIVQLLSHGKDIVGGVYPMKTMPVEWPYEPMPGEQCAGLHRAKTMPGGFLLCSRKACEAIAAAAPVYKHHMGGMHYDTRHVFDVVLEDGLLLGEDIIFSRRARDAGFDVWVDPNIGFTHSGMFDWRGNMAHAIEQGVMNRPLNHQALKSLATETDNDRLVATLKELHAAWNNVYAPPAAELLALVHLARRSKRILEAGSGLTTIVMAAANPSAEIFALEHEYDWIRKVIDNCHSHGLENVTAYLAPLSDEDWCYQRPEDFSDGPFDLVLVDGPVFLDGTRLARPQDTRLAFYDRFAAALEGAIVVIDDANHYPEIVQSFDSHKVIGGRFAICMPSSDKQRAVA